jgi:chromosome segregation protein
LREGNRAKRASADMALPAARTRLVELIQRPASTPLKKRVTFNLNSDLDVVDSSDDPDELRRQLDDSAYTLEVLQRRALELQSLVEFQNEEKRVLEEAFLDAASMSCTASSHSSNDGREMVDAAVNVVDEQARLEQEALLQREAKLAEEAAQRQREIEATRIHLRELEMSLAERNEEHARLMERVQQLDTLLRERTLEMEQLRMKLEEAIKYQETSHAIHNAASADLAARVVEKDEELTARTAEVRRLQLELEDSVNRHMLIDQMQQELGRREKELVDLRQELAEAREREARYFSNGGSESSEALRQLQEDYDQLVRESSRAFTIMAAQQESLEQRCQEVEGLNAELAQEHQLSSAEAERYRKRSAEMEAKLDQADRRVALLTQEHTEEQRMFQESEEQMAEMEAKLQQAENEKEELQAEVRDLKANVNRQRMLLVRQEASKSTHEDTVAEMTQRLDQLAQQLRQRDQQLEAARKEARTALETCQELEQRCQNYASQVTSLEHTHHELQNQLSDEQSIRARLESEVETLTGQLEEVTMMGGEQILIEGGIDRSYGAHLGDSGLRGGLSPTGSFTSLHEETMGHSFASELSGLDGSGGSGGEVMSDIFGSPHSSIDAPSMSPAPSFSSLAPPPTSLSTTAPSIAVNDVDRERLDQELSTAREKITRLNAELDEKEMQLVCIKAELSAAHNDHQRTKDALTEAQNKIRQLTERERDLAAEAEDARAELRQIRQERDEIRERCEELEEAAQSAAEKLLVARMEREYAEEAVHNLEKDIQQAAEKADARVAEVRSELEAKSRALATAGTRLAEAEAELRATVEKGILLEAEIARTRADRDEVAATLEGVRGLLSGKREEMDKLNAQIDELNNQIRARENTEDARIADLRAQVQTLGTELARVRSQIAEQRDLAEFSANEAEVREERIAELEAETKALRKQIAKLQKLQENGVVPHLNGHADKVNGDVEDAISRKLLQCNVSNGHSNYEVADGYVCDSY